MINWAKNKILEIKIWNEHKKIKKIKDPAYKPERKKQIAKLILKATILFVIGTLVWSMLTRSPEKVIINNNVEALLSIQRWSANIRQWTWATAVTFLTAYVFHFVRVYRVYLPLGLGRRRRFKRIR